MGPISVIIPCYGQAHFLGEAIESVLSQRPSASEIIVVDDGSPDDTAGVVAQYPAVRYVRQANKGLSGARNRGVLESSGDYIVFLDADDRLLPAHFQTALTAIRRHPEVALVSGAYRLFGSGSPFDVHQDCRPSPDHYGLMLRRNAIGMTATVLFNARIFKELGGFREDLKACEDYELFLRITRHYPIHCHHQPVAEYRRYPGQLSSNVAVMLRGTITVLRLQRPYIRRRPEYVQAYRDGLRQWRLLYGEPLAWQMVQARKAGDWRTVGRQLAVLVRYYPEGLLNVLHGKLLSLRTRRGAAKA